MKTVKVTPVENPDGDLESNLCPSAGLEPDQAPQYGSADTNTEKEPQPDGEEASIYRRWGSCCPFVVPDTRGPAASEHPIDIWTLRHICFGVLWAYAVFIILNLACPDHIPYKYPGEYPDANWINRFELLENHSISSSFEFKTI